MPVVFFFALLILCPETGLAWSQPLENELIIRLKPQINPVAFCQSLTASATHQNTASTPQLLDADARATSPLYNTLLIRYADPEQTAAAERRLKNRPEVDFVQPNYVRRFCDNPNDSLFSQQWALAKINAASAWNIERGQREIILAIIDSGVDYNHPDLTGNIWRNSDDNTINHLDDDGNGYVDDHCGWDFTDAPALPGLGDFTERDNDPLDEGGHGTHVAGIAAATVNNRLGISGVAPGCRIMALRAGFRMPGGGFLQDDDIAAAILYAADNGANVINMSFGDPRPSPLLKAALDYAVSKGCLPIAAAGNEGGPHILYPAAYDNVIAVGSTDVNDRLAGSSSYGAALTLTAPGVAVLSAWPGGGYQILSGTSMAAPHVTGAVGLLLSQRPGLDAENVRAILQQSAHDLGESGFDSQFGAGRLDLAAALATTTDIFARLDAPTNGQSSTGQISVYGRAAAAHFVRYRLAYGPGAAPTQWTDFYTATTPITEGLLGQFNATSFAEGEWSILLQVTDRAGKTASDAVTITIHRLSPTVASLSVTPRLNGVQWRYIAEWRTNQPTTGRIEIWPDGASSSQILTSTQIDSLHSVDLTPALRLTQGTAYVFRLYLRDLGGREIVYDDHGQPFRLADFVPSIDLRTIAQSGFEPVAELPPGRFLDRYTDFDNDNRPEIVLMPDGSTPYQPIRFYERSDAGQWIVAGSTEQSLLPWDSGDVDGDGLPELLAGGAGTAMLLESVPGGFPQRLIWQAQNVWGNRIADSDGDGRREILSRYDPPGQNEGVIIFETTGDNQFAAGLVLANPTKGLNSIGPTLAIADFDGDGRPEILAGDNDGDLFMFEATGNGQYQTIWQMRLPANSTPIVAELSPFEGDDFGVMFSTGADPETAFWSAQIFKATGDNAYEVAWQTQISGVTSGEAALKAADVDGDGRRDLLMQAAPDVYLFKNEGGFRFTPVFHGSISAANRAIFADGNGNGRLELALNQADHTVIFEQPLATLNPNAPTGLTARAEDETTIRLDWDTLPPLRYRLYRALANQPLAIDQADVTPPFIDKTVTAGQTYRYAITAVDEADRESALSSVVSVMAGPPPRLLSARFVTARQILLHFDQPLNTIEMDPGSFIANDSLAAETVLADRDGSRLLVAFAARFPANAPQHLAIANIYNQQGGQLTPNPTQLVIAYDDITPPILLEAAAESAAKVRLTFSESIDPHSANDPLQYRFQPAAIVDSVWMDSTRVYLQLREALRAGDDYFVQVDGIRDLFGNEISPGNGSLARFSTAPKSVYCYPNPARDVITFVNVPKDGRVQIFTVAGDRVLSKINDAPASEMEIALTTNDGEPFAGGIYFYVVETAGQVSRGKFAVIR